MKLNYNQISTIKHILGTTGEMETNAEGKEVPSPRRLNGEESSQRRHFNKNVEGIVKDINDKIKGLSDAHSEIVKEVRDKITKKTKKADPADTEVIKDDKVQESFTKTNSEIQELIDEKHEIELTEKTVALIKKIFKLFGDAPGWAAGDDQIVEEITEVLNA